jgi:hypothetical protein
MNSTRISAGPTLDLSIAAFESLEAPFAWGEFLAGVGAGVAIGGLVFLT